MERRRFLALAGAVSLAGCTIPSSSSRANGRLDLTVRNERDDPVTAQITVVDEEGTTYEDTSERIERGVARAFEVTVGTSGRHEATVSGDDWRGRLAWHAETCARFDGTVGLTPERVEVVSECVEGR